MPEHYPLTARTIILRLQVIPELRDSRVTVAGARGNSGKTCFSAGSRAPRGVGLTFQQWVRLQVLARVVLGLIDHPLCALPSSARRPFLTLLGADAGPNPSWLLGSFWADYE